MSDSFNPNYYSLLYLIPPTVEVFGQFLYAFEEGIYNYYQTFSEERDIDTMLHDYDNGIETADIMSIRLWAKMKKSTLPIREEIQGYHILFTKCIITKKVLPIPHVYFPYPSITKSVWKWYVAHFTYKRYEYRHIDHLRRVLRYLPRHTIVEFDPHHIFTPRYCKDFLYEENGVLYKKDTVFRI